MNIEDIAEVEEGDGNEEDDAERDVPVGGENNKKCPYCQKISPSPSKLKRHIITHTKERLGKLSALSEEILPAESPQGSRECNPSRKT